MKLELRKFNFFKVRQLLVEHAVKDNFAQGNKIYNKTNKQLLKSINPRKLK